MGGYINLAVRTKSGVSKTLSYTGVIPMLRNPDLYSENDKQENAVKHILKMYNDCPEQKDPDGRRLCPFSYGLIVVDLNTRTVLDMQRKDNITLVSASLPDRSWEFFREIFKQGWFVGGIYNALNDEQLIVPFPESPFPSFSDFHSWVLTVS